MCGKDARCATDNLLGEASVCDYVKSIYVCANIIDQFAQSFTVDGRCRHRRCGFVHQNTRSERQTTNHFVESLAIIKNPGFISLSRFDRSFTNASRELSG